VTTKVISRVMRCYCSRYPKDVYQEIMTHFHHDAPQDEVNKVRVQTEQQLGGRDSNGKPLGQIEGDGMDSLDKPKAAPIFLIWRRFIIT
jgi:hypothetical protein